MAKKCQPCSKRHPVVGGEHCRELLFAFQSRFNRRFSRGTVILSRVDEAFVELDLGIPQSTFIALKPLDCVRTIFYSVNMKNLAMALFDQKLGRPISSVKVIDEHTIRFQARDFSTHEKDRLFLADLINFRSV